MAQKMYHGDPNREHHFWVYPRHKLLQNSQWDAYDPHDICNNFTLTHSTRWDPPVGPTLDFIF